MPIRTSEYIGYPTIDPIPREEEYELINRWQQHQDQAALSRLCKANLRFVTEVAKEFLRTSLEKTDLPELAAIGATGLIEAANRFDTSKGFKFISYAVWWVRQAIQKHFADNSTTIRLPVNVRDALGRLVRSQAQQQQIIGRRVSLNEAAENAGLPAYAVRAYPLWEGGGHYLPLDQSANEDDRSPADFLADPRAVDALKETLAGEQVALLAGLLDRLDARSRRILVIYFGLEGHAPKTLEQIGQSMGITRERVRQIKEVALARLKRWAEHSPLSETMTV